MGTLAVPLMIASTVMGAYGSYKAAQSEKQAAKYNAAVAENNAIYAQQSADRNMLLAEDARKRGETDAYRKRLEIKQLAGKQKSVLASGNVDVAYGSSLDLIGDTFSLGALDVATIKNNAAREANSYENAAWSDRVQGSNYTAQSNLLRSQASQINPAFSAFSTLLSGASTLSGSLNAKSLGKETINWKQGGTSVIRG